MFYVFIVLFCFDVWLLTLFWSVKILLLVNTIFVILFLVLKRFKYLFLVFLSIFLSILSIWRFNERFLSKGFYSEKNLILTWYFTQSLWLWKCIFEDWTWRNYYIKTKKHIVLWKQYLIVWSFKKIKILTWLNNIEQYFSNPSYRFDRWLYMKQIDWRIYLANFVQLSGIYNYSIFDKIKLWIKSKIVNLYWTWENAALLLWLLVWDKSLMSNRQYRQYIGSQTVHIVAISGWNLILVSAVLWFLLFWLPFYIRLFFIFLGITGFTFIIWLDSSIFRAWIMASISIFALYFGKELLVWRLLWISALIMLIWNPYFLPYDLWFLLSFAAVWGIVVLNEVVDKRRIKYEDFYDKIRKKFWWKAFYKFVKEILFPIFWATIATLPILILFVDQVNLFWIFANLLIAFFVPVLTILGFFSLVFSFDFIIMIENLGLSYLNFIAKYFSEYTFYLKINNWIIKIVILVFIYFILGLTYWYFTRRFLR